MVSFSRRTVSFAVGVVMGMIGLVIVRVEVLVPTEVWRAVFLVVGLGFCGLALFPDMPPVYRATLGGLAAAALIARTAAIVEASIDAGAPLPQQPGILVHPLLALLVAWVLAGWREGT